MHYIYYHFSGITVIETGSFIVSSIYLSTVLLIRKVIETIYELIELEGLMFNIEMLKEFIRITIYDIVVPEEYKTPGTFKMNPGSMPNNSGTGNSNTSGTGSQQVTDKDLINTPLTQEDIKGVRKQLSNNNSKLQRTCDSLHRHLELMEETYKNNPNDFSLLNRYKQIDNNYQKYIAIQEERQEIYGKVFIQTNGDLSVLGDMSNRQITPTYANMNTRAKEALEQYKYYKSE